MYLLVEEGISFLGRPGTSGSNGIKKACGAASMEMKGANVNLMDKDQWRSFVNGAKGGFHSTWFGRAKFAHNLLME